MNDEANGPMNVPSSAAILEGAYNDLLRRSLSKISGDLARVIYLASTRDYNTGTYHHEGLAARFRSDAAAQALETAHREIFYRIAACTLEQLVAEMEIYLNSSSQSREEVLHIWQKLEPYRLALPVDTNAAVARLFVSNLRLSLAILQRQARPLVDRSAA
jgi:hypothetical protein